MALLIYDLQVRDWICVSLFVGAALVMGGGALIELWPFARKTQIRELYGALVLAAWVCWLLILSSLRFYE